MGIFAHEQRAVGLLALAVLANGLGNRRDVALGETAVERGASVAGSSERHLLLRVGDVGLRFVVSLFKLRHIDQQRLGRLLAGEFMSHQVAVPLKKTQRV